MLQNRSSEESITTLGLSLASSAIDAEKKSETSRLYAKEALEFMVSASEALLYLERDTTVFPAGNNEFYKVLEYLKSQDPNTSFEEVIESIRRHTEQLRGYVEDGASVDERTKSFLRDFSGSLAYAERQRIEEELENDD